MRSKKYNILFFVLAFLSLVCHFVYAGEVGTLYSQAIKSVRSGNSDFAFMYFRVLSDSFPESELAEPASFSVGEYYFSIGNYRDAALSLQKHNQNYPQSKATIFAFMYLLEMAKKSGKDSLVKDIERYIITFKQISFVFREFKEQEYISSFDNKYRAEYYIDKVKFYIDEELFSEIFY